MSLLRSSWQVVRQHKRAYLTLNLLYYGLVLVGMAVSFANPEVQKELIQVVGQAFSPGGDMGEVMRAYTTGNIGMAAAQTFAVNLVGGSLLVLTLPSLIIPFSGLLMGMYRALLWGLLLAPQGALALPMIPHSLTLILEGQGYILALLGVYTIGKGLFWPGAYGVQGHLRGYVAGVKRCALLYVLVILVLAVAALYEALELILIVAVLAGR